MHQKRIVKYLSFLIPLLLVHGVWSIIIVIKPSSVIQTLPNPTPILRSKIPKPIILLVPGFVTRAVLLSSDDKINGFTCQPEATPILKGDNSTYFGDMPVWFQEDGGFDVRIITLENNHDQTPSILVNAECLRQQVLKAVEQSPTQSVVIIAHSMSGLVVRAYLQSEIFSKDTLSHKKPPVSKVFLLAVPNQGMPFHFWLNLILHCESPSSKQRAACEFSSADWIKDFNATHQDIPHGVDFYTIGGTIHNGWLGFLAGCYICLTSGPNDGTIPTNSAIGFDRARGSAYYGESHLTDVGIPSYFRIYRGYKSLAYSNCMYPVLVQGNPNGCKGESPLVCQSSNALLILVADIAFSLLISRYIAHHK